MTVDRGDVSAVSSGQFNPEKGFHYRTLGGFRAGLGTTEEYFVSAENQSLVVLPVALR
jgi:hypothetical protein